MEILLEGIISREVSREVQEKAKNGEIYPHLICGVDLYLDRDVAERDGEKIDESRPCPEVRSMFFTGRHYRVIDLRDLEDYIPLGDIEEVRDYLVRLAEKPDGVNALREPVLEQEDGESAFMLTPLDDVEMGILKYPDYHFRKGLYVPSEQRQQ